MPRPTSTRGVITDAYAPGPSRRKPETRFPSGEKGVCFRGYPRKLDVGTATSRYLVNLPHDRVYGTCIYVRKCASRAYEPFFSSVTYTRGVSADFDTVAGTVGRANWLGRPLLFPGETGTGASRMEVRIRYNKGGCGWVGERGMELC